MKKTEKRRKIDAKTDSRRLTSMRLHISCIPTSCKKKKKKIFRIYTDVQIVFRISTSVDGEKCQSGKGSNVM